LIDGSGLDALRLAWLGGLWPCHVGRRAAESKHLSLDKGGLYVEREIPRQARDDTRLGSVVALSDVNNVLVERYAYDVFGRPTLRDANGAAIDESGLGNPYLFTGRRYDVEAGLYYYRARYYDYYAGRFLQPDPIGYDDGLNMYAYVGNGPLIWVDPLGLSRFWRWKRNWFTVVTSPVHGIFDLGVVIGDKIVGTPKRVKQVGRVVNTPAEMGMQRVEAMDRIAAGGEIPTTAGPVGQFKSWQKDVSEVTPAIPGVSLKGPVPTKASDVVTGLIVETVVEAINEKECAQKSGGQ